MYPVLIDRPDLHLHLVSAETFVLLAVLFCIAVGPRWAAASEGLDARRVRRAGLVLAVAILAGARAHFALNNWYIYADRPVDALKLWAGGFHVGGGLIAFVLAAPWVTARFGVPLGKFGDGVTPAVALGTAIARVGCFLQGCCFGRPCDRPWCITFPHGSWVYWTHRYQGLLPPDALRSAPVHPLQLYFAAGGILLALAALWLHRRKRYDGEVALVALLLFSVTAAVLELFRGEYSMRAYWGPLPQLLWTALAMTVASAAGLAVAEVSHRRRSAVEANAVAA